MKARTAILGLVLLSACSTAKYELNPDGSKPVLYPAARVVKWEVVDGAHQSPSGGARIYIEPEVEFDKNVRLGNGVRIGAGSYIDEDVVLFPNVTVGEESKIGGDAIVQGDVKIGSKVAIGGDSKIGPGSVIEDGATLGKWVRVGKGVSVGAGAKIGPGSVLADGAIVEKSQVLPPSSRVSGPSK